MNEQDRNREKIDFFISMKDAYTIKLNDMKEYKRYFMHPDYDIEQCQRQVEYLEEVIEMLNAEYLLEG